MANPSARTVRSGGRSSVDPAGDSLGAYPRPSGARRARGGFDPGDAGTGTSALTPHEVAVGRLPRDGLSNREIATGIFLSTRTVPTIEDGGERPLRAVQDECGLLDREAGQHQQP